MQAWGLQVLDVADVSAVLRWLRCPLVFRSETQPVHPKFLLGLQPAPAPSLTAAAAQPAASSIPSSSSAASSEVRALDLRHRSAGT